VTPRRTELTVNGVTRAVVAEPAESLLGVLRDRLGLRGSKESCGRGECGACTVLVDGIPVLSCVSLAALVTGEVVTIEGLVEPTAELRAVLADHGGFQCGFCTPGQVTLGHAVVQQAVAARHDGSLADDELDGWIGHQMSGVICRCTGGGPIVETVVEVARDQAGSRA
jgi:aerobic-type carbon monoxide dehydrogenase small subunit (CoxS/CutS family)